MKEKYYHSKSSIEEYINHAEGFSGQSLIDKLKEVLSPNSSILELGSGPGTDYEILCNTYDITGSDNSKEFLKHLTHKCRGGHFIELDAETIITTQRFDGIYSNKVLHHLDDKALKNSIQRQYDILNDKGIICHSFWKGEGDEVFKGMYVNYHTAADLKLMLGDKFEILTLLPYKEFDDEDSLLLIGKKLAR